MPCSNGGGDGEVNNRDYINAEAPEAVAPFTMIVSSEAMRTSFHNNEELR